MAAAQEERFSRRKNDDGFPLRAIDYCLREANLPIDRLDAVVFYDKPIPKFARFLETTLALAPSGLGTFLRCAPSWVAEKLNLRRHIREELKGLPEAVPILFTEHHQAHAASAFFPSPFPSAAILTVDGVGEYATTTLGRGEGHRLELLEELRFPHSVGLLYSAFTAYCGFRVNLGEYKLMGLARDGRPVYTQKIRDELLDLREDGSFRLNLDYFDFLRGTRMTNDRFHRLFGGPPRRPEERIEARHADLARSIQEVTEEILLRLVRQAHARTGESRLCLAGGVALNCVANGRILREGPFREIWIQPAAGNAGGSLGAALAVWHAGQAQIPDSEPRPQQDQMQGALLGPAFREVEVESTLTTLGAVFERLDDDEIDRRVVEWLAQEKVVGWFQGRMEFGPRALGARSLLGDPRSARMQSQMNLRVKFREAFLPFAPAVLREHVAECFDLEVDSPYMLLVASVRTSLRRADDSGAAPSSALGDDLEARVNRVRSTLPAVTHVDWSARVQTVSEEGHSRFHRLLDRWHAETGCPLLANTSFNLRGEPIVCSPDDAYRCFMNSAIDHLVIGNHVLDRDRQPVKPSQVFEDGRD